MDLRALGWDDFFAASAKGANLVPARVALVFRGGYEVWTERGEFLAQVSGRFRHLTAILCWSKNSLRNPKR